MIYSQGESNTTAAPKEVSEVTKNVECCRLRVNKTDQNVISIYIPVIHNAQRLFSLVCMTGFCNIIKKNIG